MVRTYANVSDSFSGCSVFASFPFLLASDKIKFGLHFPVFPWLILVCVFRKIFIRDNSSERNEKKKNTHKNVEKQFTSKWN